MIAVDIHTLTDTAAVVAVVFGLILVAGLAAGQFRKGVVGELRNSLSTANTELDIERKRGDRLETAVNNLSARMAVLETENRILRETLQTGLRLAPEFKESMVAMLREHEEKSRDLIMSVAAGAVAERSIHETKVAEDVIARIIEAIHSAGTA